MKNQKNTGENTINSISSMVKKSPRGEADDLLGAAERLMHRDIDKELALLKKDHFIPLVNPGKYQKAKDWFEKVIKLEPGNKRALEGFGICNEMLEMYVPEQYIASPEWIDQPREEEPKTPWEFRRGQRERDRAGLEYTAQEYAKAREAMQRKAEEIITAAKEKVKRGIDPSIAYKEAMAELDKQKKRFMQAWKGQGQEIFTAFRIMLREALGIKADEEES